ncbi:homocysteine S-methyltransferase family protein [Akkermansiaceae bacterium]|nr:homocysteine S-methyltransferase family protein [Akkermansiaceae bacterium]MDA7932152.1 homocysteine S-methyltransferase family protein [Akkermansiaceae bacterium]MDB0057039.1 homocysteine S-methyltransferase family protein [Akkermansiaceae bacterium]MDB4267789.1 homocysteine S-methyltransferase family protein [Akkermansiaceae bacterium]MDB4307532.1 homocysteine S-methyltransferase family protein [Akkermansiaceae bacterium]
MQNDLLSELQDSLSKRIMVLDGAMGTTIRGYELQESDARGDRFLDNHEDLLNNGDILSLTRPDVIGDIHKRFYEAGSDICETNTFSGTVLAQSEFFVEDPRKSGGIKNPEFFDKKVIANQMLQDLVWELNVESVKLAKQEADKVSQATGRKRYVAGAIGPLTVSLTNVVDPDDTAFRAVTFDQVKDTYRHQIDALLSADCDILMVETIFDALNAKAALVAIKESGTKAPIIISAAVGRGGETMISAQKVEALWNTFAHLKPLAIGLNCSLGPDLMEPFLSDLSKVSTSHISCYPNAGLPNPLAPTGFDLLPKDMADYSIDFADKGYVNLIGGCCGNTPEHIAAIAQAVEGKTPRALPTLG